jgi:hypothetical protein
LYAPTEKTSALLEVLDRLVAVECVVSAIRCGLWEPDPEILEALGLLLDAATGWAVRAEVAA